MARLIWDAVGTRKYNTGVDRGVLWVGTVNSTTGATTWANGVAFQGLRNVDANPDGADEQAFYADNIKYLSLRGVENFGGTIGCYYTPEEFDVCDGTAALTKGVKIGQQVRKPFCFAYRTLVGNDTQGTDLGYEIHIVYNATVSPSSRSNSTVNESPEPLELSYDFTTNPIEVTGTTYRPISHIVIASPSLLTFTSGETDPSESEYLTNFTTLEQYIYGRDASTSGGTTVTELQSTLLLPHQVEALIKDGTVPA